MWSAFPVGPLDDATNTFEITAGSGIIQSKVTSDATPADNAGFAAVAIAGSQAAEQAANSAAHSVAWETVADGTSGRAGLTIDGTQVLFLIGTGDPNTVVTATIGSLFIQTDVAGLWQNTDGVTAWTAR